MAQMPASKVAMASAFWTMNRMAISRQARGFFVSQVPFGRRGGCRVHGANDWRV
jgi:hypothetical protein